MPGEFADSRVSADLAFEAAMDEALALADAAAAAGEIPVGAVVQGPDGTIVAGRHNERESQRDPTAHAEILALRDAAAAAGRWRLDDHLLVVTLEPCPMCAGALWAARIATVVWGAPNRDAGAAGSLYNLAADPRLNHETRVVPGVRAEEAAARLRAFFATRRADR